MLKNPIFKMVITLVVIAVVVSAAMSIVNEVTEPLIAENEIKATNVALGEVLEADDYKIRVSEEGTTVYDAFKNGEKCGICVVNYATGYGGNVKVMTGIDKDKKVTGVKIMSHSETPGLGANSTKPSFYGQYTGKTEGVAVTKNSPKDNEIQAISGATITSRAVTEAVNNALKIASTEQ